jgi:hypothetical protein
MKAIQFFNGFCSTLQLQQLQASPKSGGFRQTRVRNAAEERGYHYLSLLSRALFENRQPAVYNSNSTCIIILRELPTKVVPVLAIVAL